MYSGQLKKKTTKQRWGKYINKNGVNVLETIFSILSVSSIDQDVFRTWAGDLPILIYGKDHKMCTGFSCAFITVTS